MSKGIISFLIRAGITAFALWWILRAVDLPVLGATLASVRGGWLLTAVGLSLLEQFAGIGRWKFLVAKHPALTFPFLTRSYFIACFFSTILPTTIGGDAVRGYDLIKATGEWKNSLASILMDRLLGACGFLLFGLIAWAAFPPAREDPVIRAGFLGFCGAMAVTFSLLGSKRMLRWMLKPFGKIGLGTLQSHAKQFQETLLGYARRPRQMANALGMTLIVQVLAIWMFVAVVKTVDLPVPLLFLVLMIPVVTTISQLPISLNGWGIREGATILFLQRIGIDATGALSVSLLIGMIPFVPALIGAALFLARRAQKRRLALS